MIVRSERRLCALESVVHTVWIDHLLFTGALSKLSSSHLRDFASSLLCLKKMMEGKEQYEKDMVCTQWERKHIVHPLFSGLSVLCYVDDITHSSRLNCNEGHTHSHMHTCSERKKKKKTPAQLVWGDTLRCGLKPYTPLKLSVLI